MKASEMSAVIESLLKEVQEEDVAISLFKHHYADEEELSFFDGPELERVRAILKKLSEDSVKHKAILKRVIALLEAHHEE